MLRDVQTAITITHDTLIKYGFKMSMHKTEVSALIIGHGSSRIKSEVFGKENPSVYIPCAKQRVPIVDVGKHLGTMIASDCSESPNIARRTSSQMAVEGPLRATIYRAVSIPVKKKAVFCEAFGMSRLLYNCEIWGPMGVRQRQSISTAAMKAWRNVTQTQGHQGAE